MINLKTQKAQISQLRKLYLRKGGVQSLWCDAWGLHSVLLPIWKIVVAKGVFGWLTEQKKRWKPTIRLHCLSGEHSKENVHDTGDVWLTFGR